MQNNTERARELRKNSTPLEMKIWKYLRNRNVFNQKFRRQYPIGNYIVDFICREKRLIIEIDGGQHNDSDIIEYDKNRTLYLESKGYRVLRFWNNEVNNNLKEILEAIETALEE